jgi:hypothetical protein
MHSTTWAQRVLNAARLAVAMHLSRSAAGSDAARNRQVMIGGSRSTLRHG